VVLDSLPVGPGLAVATVAVLAGGTALYLALGRLRLTDRQSFSGEAVVEAIEQPALVVDGDGTVVAPNGAFGRLVGKSPQRLRGEPLDAIPDCGDELAGIHSGSTQESMTVGERDGKRYFDVSCAPVEPADEDELALVVLGDVTERRRRLAELERENERLEEFTTLVSHDLRNPLDVAIGHAGAAAEAIEDPEIRDHLQAVEQAHDRMCEIISDTLTLTRDTEGIDTTAAVELASVARDAWATVDTGSAGLAVQGGRTVVADEIRLRHILENLFRNAVEHGSTNPPSQRGRDDGEHESARRAGETESPAGADGDTVTVEVGGTGEGFYVADDGTGVPESDREKVLTAGYSGSGGTGYGLSIVERLAEAHGWKLSVTESESGGARFELAGVEVADDEPELADR